MQKLKKVLKYIGIVLCALGMIWFFIPVVRGKVLTTGTIFGEFICLLGLFLLLWYRKIAEKGGWKLVWIRLLSFGFILGLLWSGYLTILMFSAVSKKPPENAHIIVLGARVFENGELSISLKKRVKAAYDYLEKPPESKCIATGGQGDNEPVAESIAEKKQLTDWGLNPKRIFIETKSRNTRENMLYAAQVAKEENLGTEFAIVTQEFHMFRAMKLAKDMGLKAYSLPAETDPLMFPAYYGRELLSLTKWKLEELFLGGNQR